MTLTHYIGGKITGDSTDFATLSTNYPPLSTFIDFETFQEYILVSGVWELIGVPPVVGVGGWREIARTTLGAPSTEINVPTSGGFANKKYYMILTSQINGDGSTPNWQYRIGSSGVVDVGSNYANRRELDGIEQTGLVNQNRLVEFFSAANLTRFGVSYAANLPTQEKLLQGHAVNQVAVGAGTAPGRADWVGKHAQTSSSMDVFRLSGSQTYSTGSEIVVLAWDPSDSHTDGFWEELDSVDLSSGPAQVLNTNTFANRKYLWIQYYAKDAGLSIDPVFTFNNDGAANYARRNSGNGGVDFPQTGRSFVAFREAAGINPSLINMFILNVVGQEKIGTSHEIELSGAGAINPPFRGEMVFKWANTVDPITSMQTLNAGGGGNNFGENTIIKVWGHN